MGAYINEGVLYCRVHHTKKDCKVVRIDSLRDVSIVNCALEGYAEQLGKVCICQIAFLCGQILSFML